MKKLRVTWPHGEICHIPAHIIAKPRASYYATVDNGKPVKDNAKAWNETYEKGFKFTMENDYELLDWASNNMDWKDVSAHAVFTLANLSMRDYNKDWVNAEKEIIDE